MRGNFLSSYERVYSRLIEFTPEGSKFFAFRKDPSEADWCAKHEVKQVVPRL